MTKLLTIDKCPHRILQLHWTMPSANTEHASRPTMLRTLGEGEGLGDDCTPLEARRPPSSGMIPFVRRYLAARIIFRMPALITSSSPAQASITAAILIELVFPRVKWAALCAPFVTNPRFPLFHGVFESRCFGFDCSN